MKRVIACVFGLMLILTSVAFAEQMLWMCDACGAEKNTGDVCAVCAQLQKSIGMVDEYTPVPDSIQINLSPKPEDTAVNENDAAILTVDENGTDIQYQWKYSDDNGLQWTDVENGNQSQLILLVTAAMNGRLYCCVLTDAFGQQQKTCFVKLSVLRPWFCLYCGTKNSGDIDHCAACGEYREPDWFCWSCGQKNSGNVDNCTTCGEYRELNWFCWNCGTKNHGDVDNCIACGKYRELDQ